jgi:hypothetical protein
MHRKNLSWGATPILAAILIAGCTSTPAAPRKAQITDEVAVQATVVAVDKASRELILQRSDGSQVAVVAGPEVRNFDQIAAGDTLNARYTVSLTARRLDPDEVANEPGAGMAAARAEPGEKPGAAIGAGVTMTVVVNSVDRDTHTVVVTGPDGNTQAIEAQRQTGKRFVEGLKPGDRVELTYGEALVLAVE